MNYINNYKIFESESKPSNDDYYKLCLILMDDLMDDMDIYSKTDENFDDDIPLNKFWAFNGSNKKDKMGEYILRQVRMVLLVNDVNESNRVYESQNSIVSDINEIFLSEIKDIDDGYNIEIYGYNDVLGSVLDDKIVVEISKWGSIILNKRILFKLNEIEDGIHRILNYMSDMGYTNTYITTKYRTMDDWIQLFMKEGDYTRYKLGPHEWRFDKPISRIKIIFTR